MVSLPSSSSSEFLKRALVQREQLWTTPRKAADRVSYEAEVVTLLVVWISSSIQRCTVKMDERK